MAMNKRKKERERIIYFEIFRDMPDSHYAEEMFSSAKLLENVTNNRQIWFYL
jgi:hypothetical protein